MLEELAELEEAIDRLIARLSSAGGVKQAKALLVDARRLRTLVGNWRTIAPTAAALKEMAQRIEQLARSVDAVAPQEAAPPRASRSDRDRSAPAPARTAPPAYEPIVTEPPPNPIRPRTLPDLDISGVAELMDDGPGLTLDRGAGLRAGRAEPRRHISEPVQRVKRASTPPHGRPSPVGPVGEDRGRPSRPSTLLDDPDFDEDGARLVYGEEPAARKSQVPGARRSERESSEPPARRTARESSVPPARRSERESTVPERRSGREPSQPPARRPDKTPIAVRPLPAPEALDARLILLTEPYSERAEAYRALRRKLSGPGSPKTIAVTSAQPGEGKTSCAVNLALAFRETSSEKVLLVEANLRAPSLAKLFGFEPPVCFAKQMAKNRESGRTSWTVAEQFEPLHVLAVDPASKTSPLIDPVAFTSALEQLLDAGYDHIILDTPPALGSSDMNIIADAVDGTIVVTWVKKSKVSSVKKAIEQLKPATILGVVTLDS